MKLPIYLDYHATTPVDPRVLDAMVPYFVEKFGNAASRNHPFGWTAASAVDTARAQVAALIGAHHLDIVFTSGATESNNLAIKGVAEAHRARGTHIITVVTEHHSVLDTCRELERRGWQVTWLPVGREGRVDPGQVEAAVTPATVLISVMAANNEIGVCQPLEQLGSIARRHGVTLHTDASQAAGRVRFDVETIGADLVSFTAHKMYGPKGVGALYIRRKSAAAGLSPQMHGGGHERGFRSGTLNVPGIVGFGKAAEICRLELDGEAQRLSALRDRLLSGLRTRIPDLVVNGSVEGRLPNNLNVSFPGIEAESLGLALDDVAVSSGSACATGKAKPSHVLTAIGLDPELALASLRFGLGRWTTAEEVDYAIDKVASVIHGLKALRSALGA